MAKKQVKQETFLRMPMTWDRENIFRTMWNPEDDRLLPPKSFGIGWTINLHATLRRLGLIKPNKKK